MEVDDSIDDCLLIFDIAGYLYWLILYMHEVAFHNIQINIIMIQMNAIGFQ